jgi:hypothetical protein
MAGGTPWNRSDRAHIQAMKLKLWIAGYLAVAAVAIIGVWLDCFSDSLLIVLGLILWIAPDPAVILTMRRFRKGQSNDPQTS